MPCRRLTDNAASSSVVARGRAAGAGMHVLVSYTRPHVRGPAGAPGGGAPQKRAEDLVNRLKSIGDLVGAARGSAPAAPQSWCTWLRLSRMEVPSSTRRLATASAHLVTSRRLHVAGATVRVTPLRVLVVGCGSMGTSHSLAYDSMPEFVIVGLVSRGESKATLAARLSTPPPLFSTLEEALAATHPDVVSINTYPDTHEAYALASFDAGCHVFLEKPIAPTVEASERVVAASFAAGKQLLVGYILQVHPSWIEFIAQAQALGSPKVMRLNLNQQDKTREKWDHHLKVRSRLGD